ncbi:MAG: MFS transporter, partial [Planctomycetaceae bacterium]
MSDPKPSQSPPPTPQSSDPQPASDQYAISRESRVTLPEKFTDAELKAMISDVPMPVSEARAKAHARQSRWADFWVLIGCNLVVFVSSVCIMVVELCASRLIASYLGSSLYTWTSVIGVVLAGISIGNYLGGWIADRFPPHKALGWQFLVSGLATASVLILNRVAANNTGSRPEGVPWQFWVMALVGLVFLAPAVSLGTISPVTASIALGRSRRTGVTVGNIYAWGALGSIVGTFLAGFWLIGDFGTKHIIWMTSAVLLLMGAIVSGGSRALRMFTLFGALQFVLLVGVVASVTAGQAADAARYAVQALTGFSTTAEKFEADDRALTRAQEEGNEARLAMLQQVNLRRLDQKAREDEWSAWGWGLGHKLHELGLLCGLRRDELNEYNDESDYYAINIHTGQQDGDQVKVLRLDYLVHSYYNPLAPSKLHYDYEKVYAAITERAAESWKRTISTALDQPPTAPEFAGALPDRVTFDAEARRLSIEGAMSIEQAIQLLSIVPDGQ